MGNQANLLQTKLSNYVNQAYNKEPQIYKFNWEGFIEEKEGSIWDSFTNQFIKTKWKITFTKNQEIKYSLMDGSILRMLDIAKDISEKPKNLHWLGEYGKNNKKVGKWIAIWNGEVMNDVGGFYQKNGQKQGLWKKLFHNYQRKAQIYQIGEYFNGKRKGTWRYIYKNQLMYQKPEYIRGCGIYNEIGQKDGEWIELSKNFQDESQIVYTGKYKGGKKIGIWNTKTRENINLQFQQIAGGSYEDQEQNNAEYKIGEWVELFDGFRKYCRFEKQFFINNNEINFKGKYQNGIKIGCWNFFYNGRLIGGGKYDQQQNLGIKIGKWIELSDRFCDFGQVIYTGEYQNGKKVGKWNIYFMDPNTQQYTQIGGGFYNEQQQNGIEIKTGQWVEVIDETPIASQVFYKGEYKKGQKIGRWDIYIKDNNFVNCVWIGGGSYEETQIGNSRKRGKWFEICDNFGCEKPIIYQGEYKNGNKIGIWLIYYKDNLKKTTQQIGCGVYNDKLEGLEIKEGLWVELNHQFLRLSQVKYQGIYKNGIKIGKWNTYYKQYETNQDNLIGGGEYINQQGYAIKNGYWVEICDDFHRNIQITYQGEYVNLKKVGTWDTFYYWNKREKIGGGQYESKEEGGGIKIGKWTVLEDTFRSDRRVISKGIFEKGKKVGKWKYYYKQKKKFEYIGGGTYDKTKILGHEIKIGKWVVPIDSFGIEIQVTSIGEYLKGQKVGRWDTCWRERDNQSFSLIGGGLYDDQQQAKVDMKTGKWIELSDQFRNYNQVIYQGVYRDGFKISKWDVMKRENAENEFKKVGEEEYNL